MKDILDTYGDAILAIAASTLFLTIFLTILRHDFARVLLHFLVVLLG